MSATSARLSLWPRGGAVCSSGAEAGSSWAVVTPPGRLFPLKLTLQVAEDNLINQKVVLAILRKIVTTPPVVANNGLEAIAAYREHYFDLILMDVQASRPAKPSPVQWARLQYRLLRRRPAGVWRSKRHRGSAPNASAALRRMSADETRGAGQLGHRWLLALTDVRVAAAPQMPMCDGIEATRRIRAYEAEALPRRSAHIVGLTAHASAEARRRP